MAMSEEEILREAARIQASRRKRVAKQCERCGADFIGVAQAKYCSDACRMAAAREPSPEVSDEPEQSQHIVRLEPFLPGESIREYFVRTAVDPLSDDDEELIAAMERVEDFRKRIDSIVGDTLEPPGRHQASQQGPYSGHVYEVEARQPGESLRSHVARQREVRVASGAMTLAEANVTKEDERRIAASELLDHLQEQFANGAPHIEGSTELIRRERDKRSRYLWARRDR
jgi:hypothetical protein